MTDETEEQRLNRERMARKLDRAADLKEERRSQWERRRLGIAQIWRVEFRNFGAITGFVFRASEAEAQERAIAYMKAYQHDDPGTTICPFDVDLSQEGILAFLNDFAAYMDDKGN